MLSVYVSQCPPFAYLTKTAQICANSVNLVRWRAPKGGRRIRYCSSISQGEPFLEPVSISNAGLICIILTHYSLSMHNTAILFHWIPLAIRIHTDTNIHANLLKQLIERSWAYSSGWKVRICKQNILEDQNVARSSIITSEKRFH